MKSTPSGSLNLPTRFALLLEKTTTWMPASSRRRTNDATSSVGRAVLCDTIVPSRSMSAARMPWRFRSSGVMSKIESKT